MAKTGVGNRIMGDLNAYSPEVSGQFPASPFLIGRFPASPFLRGSVDITRVWNKPLMDIVFSLVTYPTSHRTTTTPAKPHLAQSATPTLT